MSTLDLRNRVDAVVIGASAGGIEALGTLIPSLPADLAVPVFIVLHLPKDHRSLLTEIFQPKCRRPVREAQDKEPIAGGTVYFAPPDYHLLVDDGPQAALSTEAPINFSRPSIDALFESAVDWYGSRLAAILLTGASQDGAAGVVAVERAGGTVIVQDPAETLVATMVETALTRTTRATVLPLSGIAAVLSTLGAGGLK